MGRGGCPRLRRAVVPAPMRGMVAAFRPFPCRAMARRYSTAKMLLGCASSDASTPGSVPSACCRAAAEGDAVLLPVPQRTGKRGTVQTLRRGAQGGQVAGLRAEQQRVHHPGPGQQRHAALGEPLRRGHGPQHRQLQHQIRAAPNGHLRTGRLGHGGEAAPLGEAAAHGAHHGGRAHGPGLGQQVGVSPVQGSNSQMIPTFMAALLSFFLYFT